MKFEIEFIDTEEPEFSLDGPFYDKTSKWSSFKLIEVNGCSRCQTRMIVEIEHEKLIKLVEVLNRVRDTEYINYK